jgi:hypothetical protein
MTDYDQKDDFKMVEQNITERNTEGLATWRPMHFNH